MGEFSVCKEKHIVSTKRQC